MEVTHATDHITHAIIGGKQSMNFGISDDPAFFQILSSALYKNPELAMVRETICNAWDAHIDAGIADKPVDVKQVAAKAKDSKVSLTKTEAPKPLSQKDEVQAMWDEALKGNKKKAQELLDFKKAAKKGWSVWGLDPSAGDTLKALIGN